MRYLASFLLFFALALTAQAQFQIGLTLPRTNFMPLEAIQASVTITNRSGAEVVLGGPGRASWLSFEMTDNTGHPLAPMDASGVEMVQIAPGATIQRRVMVTDAYSPTNVGNYGLTVRVAHAPSGQFYTSSRVRFNIMDSKPMWEQVYGVPEGFKGAGTMRRYSIILFMDYDSTSLYFQLKDDRSNARLQTYRLGPVTMAHDPQITIDKNNKLHVLFLAQPHLYAYCIVNPDGALAKRSYYREEGGNRPRMSVAANGEAEIDGGIYFDPNKAPEKPAQGGRNISEKPPGLD